MTIYINIPEKLIKIIFFRSFLNFFNGLIQFICSLKKVSMTTVKKDIFKKIINKFFNFIKKLPPLSPKKSHLKIIYDFPIKLNFTIYFNP